MPTEYTVVGLYRDNNQPFVTVVHAYSVQTALSQAVLEALDLNGWGRDRADDICVVAILFGRTSAATLNGDVWPGSKFLCRENKASKYILSKFKHLS